MRGLGVAGSRVRGFGVCSGPVSCVVRVSARPSREEVMNESELAVVATFRSTADAQVAKGVLDEVGIESMIRSDNAGGMYPALSGADLLVRAEDVEKADEALNGKHPQSE